MTWLSPLLEHPLTHRLGLALVALLWATAAPTARGDDIAEVEATAVRSDERPQAEAGAGVLSPEQRGRVDAAVDRAVAWLATQQNADGSFACIDAGQPGVTSLAVLALLSRGHRPGAGPHGRALERAIDVAIACQKPDGLLCKLQPEPAYVTGTGAQTRPVHTGLYNHAITIVMLCQAFGTTDDPALQKRMRRAIEAAIVYAVRKQAIPKKAFDRGGWRYVERNGEADSDLSVTSWMLMFLRAAKNTGFDVPPAAVEQATAYVKRCFTPKWGSFRYCNPNPLWFATRAGAGMGVLSLSLAGQHETDEAQKAGKWILGHGFAQYNAGRTWDRYHYALFYCTQAMFQLGGDYWQRFFPPTAATLLANQRRDGSWDVERIGNNAVFGNVYTTSLVVLSLTTPDQLLPIFQR